MAVYISLVTFLVSCKGLHTLFLSDHGERRMKGSQMCTVRAARKVTQA